MIGSRLGELGVKRLDDIRIGRSGLGDLQGAETVLRGHKVHEVGVDGVGDVDEELIRSAAIDGGKRSMWVMNRRADHWLSWPIFTQYLPCLAVPGAAVQGMNRLPHRRKTATRFAVGAP